MDSEVKVCTWNSTESNRKEFETKPLASSKPSNTRCTKQYRKLQFKTPVLQKRPKIELETKGTSTTSESINNSKEKKNTVRRLKRNKNQGLRAKTKKQMFDSNMLKDDMKCEDEKIQENNLNTISPNVIKCLDNTFFQDVTESMICNSKADDVSLQDQFSIKPNNVTECHLANNNENISHTNLLGDMISSNEKALYQESADELNLPNIPHTIFKNGIAENGKGIMEEKVENYGKDTAIKLDVKSECEDYFIVTKSQNYLNLNDDEHILNKNDITHSAIDEKWDNFENRDMQKKTEFKNEALPIDTSFDHLCVDIKAADAIISILTNTKNTEEKNIRKDCKKEENSENSDQNITISESSIKQNKSGNESELSESSFAVSEKYSDNQEKTYKNENKDTVQNTSTERNEEITYLNSKVEEKDTELQCTHTNTIKHINSCFLTDEQFNYTSDSNFDKSSCKECNSNHFENMKIFISENTVHLDTTERNIKGQKLLKNSEVSLNETSIEKQSHRNNDEESILHTEIHNLNGNFELKREKLTLLYMNALDYEKELNEEKEINKGSYTEGFNNSEISDNGTQKNLENCEQDLTKTFDTCDQKQGNKSQSRIDRNKKENNDPSEMKEKNDSNSMQNISDMNKSIINNFTEENTMHLHHLYNIQPITKDQQQKIEQDILKYDFNDKKNENSQIYGLIENDRNLCHNKNIPAPQSSMDTSMQENIISNDEIEIKIEETNKCYKNKYLNEEMSLLDTSLTSLNYFDLELEKLGKKKNSGAEENIIQNNKNDINSNEESKSPGFDAEENFDLDDDFELTASQINIIEANEQNQLKQSNNTKKNSCQQTEACSSTHFGLDSLTAEIIDQLCYIRESVESIKELLHTKF